ncbi:TerB N-terminal domain-containing protein [Tumebacillus permanentifrigoris]|uniref:TerB-like protein n=1 Tax=Tumebacillus permanentifrigoris TaxID=378543 RepID=A0A316DAY3_9BACL|nr:TerB N-terminal domain-containing protein [Tumebacillus permanentifrigoris]PWK14888.1 TerB-like protein [Tumebacillus permanentifrigoris]
MQFREAVRRYRDQHGTAAPEVEFSHNWPKHEHLDPAQLRWFLYWRTLWEGGSVQKTGLSYMMIHIYELLSLEYIQEPEQAVERLVKFYTEFRDIQPRLDVTVVRWIGDLYLKMGEIDNALYWYTHGTAGDLFEKLSWYRYGHRDIPLWLFQKIAGVPKSQFYREHLPEIESELEWMMQAVFRKFYELEGMHPLDKFARYTDEPTIYLFSSTPIHEKYYLDGFRRFEQSGPFVHFVKHALRYAENLLRRGERKPRLKCDESLAVYFQDLEARYPLPEVVEKEKKKEPRISKAAAIVEEPMPTLAVEMPVERVEIDFSRVQALTNETEWLVDMMSEGTAGDELLVGDRLGRKSAELANPEESAPQSQSAENGTSGTRSSPFAFAEDENSGATLMNSLFSDAEAGELAEFLASLSEGEQAFLRHLAQSGERARRSLAEWLKAKRMFLDATVMRLNEAAMDAGFEPLIEEGDDELSISEEHETALQEWALR